MKRPQAGDLPLQRRRGDGRSALAAVGQLRDEERQVARLDVERVAPDPAQKLAVLLKVGSVGLERVARQPTLELEVGQEVERELGQSTGGSGSFGCGHD